MGLSSLPNRDAARIPISSVIVFRSRAAMPPRAKTVSAPALRAMIVDGDEIALLDVREEGVFGRRPPAFRELRAAVAARTDDRGPGAAQLGRASCCATAATGLAERAAARLAAMGYDDVALSRGRHRGLARRRLSSCSPASTCRARRSASWSSIAATRRASTAAELQRQLDAGEDLVILDSRPIGEFHNMSIPGGIDCPGAELVYRVHGPGAARRTAWSWSTAPAARAASSARSR